MNVKKFVSNLLNGVQILQLFINLCLNAFDQFQRGEICVRWYLYITSSL